MDYKQSDADYGMM